MKKTLIVLLITFFAVSCSNDFTFMPFGGSDDNPTLSSPNEKVGTVSINLSQLVQPTSNTRSIDNTLLKPEVNFFQVFIYHKTLMYTNSINTETMGTMLNTEVFTSCLPPFQGDN